MNTAYPRHIGVVAAFLVALGVWYALFGVYVLANLSSVTNAWILASGDPDFILSLDGFAMMAFLTSAAVLILGVLTAVHAAGILARREWAWSPAWLGITVIAVAVHLLRLLIQKIDKTLTWPLAAWFLIVCVAYATVWMTVRRRLIAKWSTEPPNHTNVTNPTNPTNPEVTLAH